MKLNSNEAYELLMKAKAKSDGGYIDHSLVVGEAASRIAQELNLDADKAKTLGYIHDIGKRNSFPFDLHDIQGYEYLLSLGIDEEYANICLTHSYLNNDIACVAGGYIDPDSYKYEFRKEFIKNHEYSIYEKIINLCDLMCTNKFLTLEERLIDLITRKGAHKNTQYHVIEAEKLKKEIEQELGQSIYSLFPEIVNRIGKDTNSKILRRNKNEK